MAMVRQAGGKGWPIIKDVGLLTLRLPKRLAEDVLSLPKPKHLMLGGNEAELVAGRAGCCSLMVKGRLTAASKGSWVAAGLIVSHGFCLSQELKCRCSVRI